MDFIILDNQLKADDFIRLFAAVGWGDVPRDMVETALRNSYASFSLVHESHVVGMARLLGDGAMAFFLKDFVIEPTFQGRGAGRRLLAHIEEYIRSQLQPGWTGYLQLVSAK
ncbi:MAG: GNAT family N-acetyltransferase, partial [Clostridia bacterium]|nr:GNAT family N-acetyltransferase [Clostridia bacterium]